MSKRAYFPHGLAVLFFSVNGALLLAKGIYYTDGVPGFVTVGIYFAGFAAAAFTSAVTTADKRS